MRYPSVLRRTALVSVLFAPALAAQGAVSGQVTLIERPGESSEDLADVVVWLEPTGSARGRMNPAKTTIQLQGRQFSPRVRVVPEGSKIAFPNQDSFSHNVFSKAPSGPFDTGVYGRGKSNDQTFREAGVYPIYCNIHPRMTGYVIVLKSPWFAQASDDGRFSVGGVPAGSYTMHIWHDRAAPIEKPLVVGASGAAVGRVELDASGYRFVQHKNKFGQEYTNAAGDRY